MGALEGVPAASRCCQRALKAGVGVAGASGVTREPLFRWTQWTLSIAALLKPHCADTGMATDGQLSSWASPSECFLHTPAFSRRRKITLSGIISVWHHLAFDICSQGSPAVVATMASLNGSAYLRLIDP